MNDLIVKKAKFGKAVFAKNKFRPNEIILEFKGKIFHFKDTLNIDSPEEDRFIQISKNNYLGPSGGFDDYVNHSCNPNAGIKFIGKKLFLVAIKNIRIDEEITFDYSTTMDEDYWELRCECKSKNCRKIIRDFKYLPKKTQDKYIKLGIVPRFILKNIKLL